MTVRTPRIGVITFPGSLDDRDALSAIDLMGGEGVRLWHADADLRGVDGVILPGGFSYGDYLRCGAIARFAAVMDEVRAFAERGGPVLGICNGFQILCESGLLAGALIRNRSLRFVCRDVWLRVETSQSALTNDLTAGETVEIPIKHGEGAFVARPEELRRIADEGLVVFRYASRAGVVDDAPQPERRHGQHRGDPQRTRQRGGPDAAPRARGGSRRRSHRGPGRCCASLLASAMAGRARERGSGRARGVAAPPAGPDGRRARTDRRHARARAAARRTGDVRRDVVGALLLQVVEDRTCARCPPRAPPSSSAPARTPAPWTWATAGPPCSRWSRTRTRRAIEPYQGAATGVGGIVRDIISMGARPVALLDPLMFGPLTEERNRWLLGGVVAGIGGYGNCIGVPTVGGEVHFADTAHREPERRRDVRGPRARRRPGDVAPRSRRTRARSWCSTARPPGVTASAA